MPVDKIFALPGQELTPVLAWLAVICYTLQIYFDFSGYSDMAVGLGKMFGFVFLENFNFPYTAQSIKDFWRRWHISLSTWFRDYLYIPMGGNRCPVWRNHLNLVIVFFLCGLWHGASWTFVIWGLYHGIFPGAGADAVWGMGGRAAAAAAAWLHPAGGDGGVGVVPGGDFRTGDAVPGKHVRAGRRGGAGADAGAVLEQRAGVVAGFGGGLCDASMGMAANTGWGDRGGIAGAMAGRGCRGRDWRWNACWWWRCC